MSESPMGYQPGERPFNGSQHVLNKFLGRGEFGEVWKAVGPGGGEVGLKILDLTRAHGQIEYDSLKWFIRIRHPNLTSIHASWVVDQDNDPIDDSPQSGHPAGQGGDRPDASSEKPRAFFRIGPFRPRTRPRKRPDRQKPSRLVVHMDLGQKCLFKRLRECVPEGQSGSVPVEELLHYMEGAAHGLDYLHAPLHDLGHGNKLRIIHRDVKPANILIVGDSAKVCDFGLARARDQEASKSQTSMMVGTICYMAPEVFQFKPAQARSDQYSFAVTYFQLRTNSFPFGSSSEPTNSEVAEALLQGRLNFTAIPEFERDVIAKATSKNPSQRFESCVAMVDALKEAVKGRRHAAVETPEPNRPAAPPAGLREPSQPARPPRPIRLAEVDSVHLNPGGRAPVQLQVERNNNPGPIQVEVDGVPEGISFVAPEIPDGESVGQLELAADETLGDEELSVMLRVMVRVGGFQAAQLLDLTVDNVMVPEPHPAPEPIVPEPPAPVEKVPEPVLPEPPAPVEKVPEPVVPEPPAPVEKVPEPVLPELPPPVMPPATSGQGLPIAGASDRYVRTVMAGAEEAEETEEAEQPLASSTTQKAADTTQVWLAEPEASPPPEPARPRRLRYVLAGSVLLAVAIGSAGLADWAINQPSLVSRVLAYISGPDPTQQPKPEPDPDPTPNLNLNLNEDFLVEDFHGRLESHDYAGALEMLRKHSPAPGNKESLENEARQAWLAYVKQSLSDTRAATGLDALGTECDNLLARFPNCPGCPECSEAKLLRAGIYARNEDYGDAREILDTGGFEGLGADAQMLHGAVEFMIKASDPPANDVGLIGLVKEIGDFRTESFNPDNEFWNLIDPMRSQLAAKREGHVEALVQKVANSKPDEALTIAQMLVPARSEGESPLEQNELRAVAVAIGSFGENESLPMGNLDGAIRIVRDAYDGDRLYRKELSGVLRNLWDRRTAQRVIQEDPPAKSDLTALENDLDRIREYDRPGGWPDGWVQQWVAECLFELGGDVDRASELADPAQSRLDSDAADALSTRDEAYRDYVHYIWAWALNNAGRPDWDEFVDELQAAFRHQGGGTGPLSVTHRRSTAGKMALDAAAEWRGRSFSRWRFANLSGGRDRSAGDQAEKLYKLFKSIGPFQLPQGESPERELRASLALAAFFKPQEKDFSIAWNETFELLPELDATAGAWEAFERQRMPLLCACLSSYSELFEPTKTLSAERRVAIKACGDLIRLVDKEEPNLDEKGVEQLYAILVAVEPSLESFGRLPDAPAQDPLPEILAELYATVAEWIWNHPDVEQSFEEGVSRSGRVEKLLSPALDRLSPAADDAQAKRTRAQWHLTRADARLRLFGSEYREGSREDVEAMEELMGPNVPRAFSIDGKSIKAEASLVESRDQELVRNRLGLLEGIITGHTHDDERPPGDRSSEARLSRILSLASLELANWTPFGDDRDFSRRTKLLEDAVRHAGDATGKTPRFPEEPYMALGNAYEDLAWLVATEPELNYGKAIDAFNDASRQSAKRRGRANLGLGRCYYKIWEDRQRLDLQQIVPRNEDPLTEESCEQKCKAALDEAIRQLQAEDQKNDLAKVYSCYAKVAEHMDGDRDKAANFVDEQRRLVGSPAQEERFEGVGNLYAAGEYEKVIELIGQAIPEPSKADPADIFWIEKLRDCHDRLSAQASRSAESRRDNFEKAIELARIRTTLVAMESPDEMATHVWGVGKSDTVNYIRGFLLPELKNPESTISRNELLDEVVTRYRDAINLMAESLQRDRNKAKYGNSVQNVIEGRVDLLRGFCAEASSFFGVYEQVRAEQEARTTLAETYDVLARAIEAAIDATLDTPTKDGLKDEKGEYERRANELRGG